MTRKSILISVFAASALLSASCGDITKNKLNIIPVPSDVKFGSGSCNIAGGFKIETEDELLIPAAAYLEASLGKEHQGQRNAVPVNLLIDTVGLTGGSYRLAVGNSNIDITGGSYEGVISGIATFRQLLWSGSQSLPQVTVEDSPRFSWRGAMLDVSRHFFTEKEVKSLIDEMALYKLNKLHLHLTDDQGWRIEIKSMPELTERGAWRTMNNWDSTCVKIAAENADPRYEWPEDRVKDGLYGGYFTQDEMRGIIRYAEDRGIEIIPEIDMPGHSLAVLKSYPQFSCDGKGGAWGQAFSTPLCLGNDDALAFCKSVLDEVFSLFPSEYVHIGGDEVDRTAWEHCPACGKRVRDNHLGGVENLQSWFTREMEKYCREHGKKIIGWDEIASDGLSQESMVMWWRSWSPASLKKSFEEGHPVVITPIEYYYLKDDQDKNSLAKVYNYEPNSNLSQPYSGHVAGVQGNLWSEKAVTMARVGERMFPRLLAIAESAWTMPESKDFNDFSRRLPVHLQKLEEAGWSYRFPDVNGVYDRNVMAGEMKVALGVPEGAVLHYTLDGSVPDQSSPVYSSPILIKDSCDLRYRCYNAAGVPGELRHASYIDRQCRTACLSGGTISTGIRVLTLTSHLSRTVSFLAR